VIIDLRVGGDCCEIITSVEDRKHRGKHKIYYYAMLALNERLQKGMPAFKFKY
jgi:hypothetical protein